MTPTHHLPVGPECCGDVKMAKDVAVGETVWTAHGRMALAAEQVYAYDFGEPHI